MKTVKRRRKENRTDYARRMGLLKSELPRIVFRKSNRYIIAEYVTSDKAQDQIVFGVTSKELLKKGWPENMKGSLKSIPAAYLTGILIGKKIGAKETPILDLGMIRAVKGNRAFAFIKGLVDSGVKIKHEEKIFPDEERVKGKMLKKPLPSIFDKVKSNILGGEK